MAPASCSSKDKVLHRRLDRKLLDGRNDGVNGGSELCILEIILNLWWKIGKLSVVDGIHRPREQYDRNELFLPQLNIMLFAKVFQHLFRSTFQVADVTAENSVT